MQINVSINNPFFLFDLSPVSNWILTTGAWNDAGVWIDSETWNDS